MKQSEQYIPCTPCSAWEGSKTPVHEVELLMNLNNVLFLVPLSEYIIESYYAFVHHAMSSVHILKSKAQLSFPASASHQEWHQCRREPCCTIRSSEALWNPGRTLGHARSSCKAESKDSFFWEIQAKPSYLYQPVFKWRYWEISTVAIARICLLLQTYHDLHVAPLTLQYSGDCNRVHFPGDSIKKRRSLASGEKTGPSMFDNRLQVNKCLLSHVVGSKFAQ